jgi:hypothetical protein
MRSTAWGNLPEKLDALGAEYILVEEDAGHVPAGAIQTIDQSKADRVATNREDHRYRAACVLRGARRSNVAGRRDHDHALSHQLGGERR